MDNSNLETAEVVNNRNENRNENENEILLIQKKKIIKIITVLKILKNRLENMLPEDNPSITNTTDIAQRENIM